MILKVGEVSRYILLLFASNSIVGLETSPTQVTEVYLQPLLSFSSVIATFEKFFRKNVVWRGMLVLNFGVSTTILNPVHIFCRWYKLNFGLLQGQVKFYHFYE